MCLVFLPFKKWATPKPANHLAGVFGKLKEVAPHTFWSQYMQSPMVQGGNIIKLSWWKTYKPEATLEAASNKGGLIFLTADTAYKAKSSSDASVIRAWEGTREHLYCLDAVYGRWEFPLPAKGSANILGKVV